MAYSKTKEEQQIIARQSQMTSALTYFQLVGKKPKISDVVKLSAMLEKFIVNGYTKELNDMMERADDIIAQIDDK